MSLSRLLLRSLAIAAISKQDDDAESPTLAEDRVFDSRLDPVMFTAETNEIPCVIVYTDDDGSELINRGSGDGPRRRSVELRVEILLGSASTIVVDTRNEVGYVVPTTDAQLEAKLDMFEQQVRWALMDLPNRKYTNAFVNFVIRVENIQSHVQRDETGNNRIAARVLHLNCVINDDCPPAWYSAIEPSPPEEAPIDTSKLTPWITQMIVALKCSPSMRLVVNQLTGAGANSAVFVPLLRRIGINVDAIGPEADPNILAAKGLKHGPDGRIEVQNLMEFK